MTRQPPISPTLTAIHAATARSTASASTKASLRRIVDSDGNKTEDSIPCIGTMHPPLCQPWVRHVSTDN